MATDDTSGKAEIERVPATDARDRLTELMNRARFADEAFVLTRNGEDIALVIGAQNIDRVLNPAA